MADSIYEQGLGNKKVGPPKQREAPVDTNPQSDDYNFVEDMFRGFKAGSETFLSGFRTAADNVKDVIGSVSELIPATGTGSKEERAFTTGMAMLGETPNWITGASPWNAALGQINILNQEQTERDRLQLREDELRQNRELQEAELEQNRKDAKALQGYRDAAVDAQKLGYLLNFLGTLASADARQKDPAKPEWGEEALIRKLAPFYSEPGKLHTPQSFIEAYLTDITPEQEEELNEVFVATGLAGGDTEMSFNLEAILQVALDNVAKLEDGLASGLYKNLPGSAVESITPYITRVGALISPSQGLGPGTVVDPENES